MFGVSFPELFCIFLVALLLFGPEKLPEISRTFGRIMRELKKGSDSFRKEFYNAVYTPPEEMQALKRELKSVKSEILQPPTPDNKDGK